MFRTLGLKGRVWGGLYLLPPTPKVQLPRFPVPHCSPSSLLGESEASGKSSSGSHLRKAKRSSALALALRPEPPLPWCEPVLSSPWKLPGAWHDSRDSSELRPLLQSELPSSSTLWTLSTPQPTSTLTFSDAPLRIGILEVFRLGLGQRDCNFRQVGQTPLTGSAWVLAPATRLNQACGQLEKLLPGRPTPPCTDTVDDF